MNDEDANRSRHSADSGETPAPRARAAAARTGFAEILAGLWRGAWVGGLIAGAAIGWSRWQHPTRAPAVTAATVPQVAQHSAPRMADLRGENASTDVHSVADWVAASADAGGSDFVIVDKKDAQVYVFDGAARLRGTSPILLGGARGDDSVPGIGSKAIEDVLPEERTTPAGRFLGERGHNAHGDDVVWVDYDAAVSMHRVITSNPKERRLERLASPTKDDNRISYGCINVPVAFFEQYIAPAFVDQRAVVYVLPEVKPLEAYFGPLATAGARAQPATPGAVTLHAVR